ncbi:MAG TPA: M56 family metallopeptidase, partial [Vicinamibacterales bacterium]
MVPSLTDSALWVSTSPELSLLVKATLILIVGIGVALLARTARASARHLVIATSFLALVALPIVTAMMPPLTIEVSAPQSEPRVLARPARSLPETAAQPANTAPELVPQPIVPSLSRADWLRIAWAIGAVVFLVPVASAMWRLSMIRRTGLPVTWRRAELSQLAAARGVSRPVELLEHEAVPGPMTFGVTRPVIVLPLDAREWSEAELRRALTHEIEHIQRGDWLMQIVART